MGQFICRNINLVNTTQSKVELNLHMKSHTGESPEKMIDESFAAIVKSSPRTIIKAAMNVFTGPNTRSTGKLYSSQPPGGADRSKDAPTTSKRMRGTSMSPEYSKASKKPATDTGKNRH